MLLAELDRLQGLVDDLLLLARGDERALATTSFSIADVARDIGARARRVPVDVTVGDGVDPVVGDEAAVARAVDHLVANAARHAATAVRIEVATDGERRRRSSSTTTARGSRWPSAVTSCGASCASTKAAPATAVAPGWASP